MNDLTTLHKLPEMAALYIKEHSWLAKAVTVQPNGCMTWNGKSRSGHEKRYAATKWRGKTVSAHRMVYRRIVGQIPDGLVIDHLCRNTLCVNPSHLEAVTQSENIKRGMLGKSTHCKNGHLRSEHSHYVPSGDRYCARCISEKQAVRVECDACGKNLAFGSLYLHNRKFHPQNRVDA